MPAFDHSLTYRHRALRNIPHQLRLRAIEREIRKLSFDPGLEYADFGCSNGYITDRVRQITQANQTWGFDHVNDHLERGRVDYPAIQFSSVNLNEPSNSGSHRYDLVTCFETLEHVGRAEVAIDNLLAALKPNGVALITVPIEIGPRGLFKFAAKMAYGYNLSELPQLRWRFSHYVGALIMGVRMSRFRDSRTGWGTHFGFDYRDIDDYLLKRSVPFSAWNQGTTRFYRVISQSRSR